MVSSFKKCKRYIEELLLNNSIRGVVNVFTLDIIKNDSLQKELSLQKLTRMNRNVNSALFFAIFCFGLSALNYGVSGKNSIPFLTSSATTLLCIIFWKVFSVTKLRWLTPMFSAVLVTNNCIHINLTLRNILAWEQYTP